MTETFFVDVWSDVVCPFCYLGTRQLSAALDEFDHRDDVVLRHRAFELDAHAPATYDLAFDEQLAAKYSMPIERAHSLHERLESDAAALGMTWSMKKARPSNTFDAHRLIALATTQDLGAATSERLFRAYFSEGELLSDRDALESLGADVGVSDVARLWDSNVFSTDVRHNSSGRTSSALRGCRRCCSTTSSWWWARRAPTRCWTSSRGPRPGASPYSSDSAGTTAAVATV